MGQAMEKPKLSRKERELEFRMNLVLDAAEDVFNEHVITSYSIHYTKLYEFFRVFRAVCAPLPGYVVESESDLDHRRRRSRKPPDFKAL